DFVDAARAALVIESEDEVAVSHEHPVTGHLMPHVTRRARWKQTRARTNRSHGLEWSASYRAHDRVHTAGHLMACVRVSRLVIAVFGGLGPGLLGLVLMFSLRWGLLSFVLMAGLSLRRFAMFVFRVGLIILSVVVMASVCRHR